MKEKLCQIKSYINTNTEDKNYIEKSYNIIYDLKKLFKKYK